MTCGLVHASYSLPKWQAVKLTFFAPCSRTPGTKTLRASIKQFELLGVRVIKINWIYPFCLVNNQKWWHDHVFQWLNFIYSLLKLKLNYFSIYSFSVFTDYTTRWAKGVASEWGYKNQNSSYWGKFKWNFDPRKGHSVQASGKFKLNE